jgi:hypothetical protein
MIEVKTTDYDILETAAGKFVPRKIETGERGANYDTLAECRKAIVDYVASQTVAKVHTVDGTLEERESLHGVG